MGVGSIKILGGGGFPASGLFRNLEKGGHIDGHKKFDDLLFTHFLPFSPSPLDPSQRGPSALPPVLKPFAKFSHQPKGAMAQWPLNTPLFPALSLSLFSFPSPPLTLRPPSLPASDAPPAALDAASPWVGGPGVFSGKIFESIHRCTLSFRVFLKKENRFQCKSSTVRKY
jgi:hypothetical protein